MTDRPANDRRKSRTRGFGDIPKLELYNGVSQRRKHTNRDNSPHPHKLEEATLNLIASLKDPGIDAKRQTVVPKKVTSTGYRGPACNFLCDARPSVVSGSTSPLSKSECSSLDRSPRASRRYRVPLEDVMAEEPSDLVVWNPSKKVSRSNMLCPLTDSEYRKFSPGKCQQRPRELSAPSPYQEDVGGQDVLEEQDTLPLQPAPPPLTVNNVIVKADIICRDAVQLIDDLPHNIQNNPVKASPSPSAASTTYSGKISLVTLQLEEIQKAQNDVLKHLGEEIQKMTDDNERLNKEIDHVRTENDSLVSTIEAINDELERLKQILRIRGLSHALTESSNDNDSLTSNVDTANYRKQVTTKPENLETENDLLNDATNEDLSEKPPISDLTRVLEETNEMTPKPVKIKKTGEKRNSPQPTTENQIPERSPRKDKKKKADRVEKVDSVTDSSKNLSDNRKHRHHHHSHSHRHEHESRHRSHDRSSRRSASRSRSKSKSRHNSADSDKRSRSQDSDEVIKRPKVGRFTRFFSCCWVNGIRTDSVDDLAFL